MAYTYKPSYERWVDQISTSMKTNSIFVDESSSKENSLCILAVPQSLIEDNPEAYKPQKLGLGPYHHFRDEVYKMEWDKVATVRSALTDEQKNDFNTLVANKIKPLYNSIHAFYGNFFDIDADTFAWMFAVDGLFLLVQIYSKKQEFVGDIMMLENQIPFRVLKELQSSFQGFMNQEKDVDLDSFSDKLVNFCREITPLDLAEKTQLDGFNPSCQMHLLDLLYKLILNNVSNGKLNHGQLLGEGKATYMKDIKESVREKFLSCLSFRQGLGHVIFLTKTAFKVALHLFSKKDEERSEQEKINAQEIRIPSVSQLCDIANVDFRIAPGGIKNVEFDKERHIFYLPTITLNENTEVILRNLVAYEATRVKCTDVLPFAEYVDLMCGIIDKPRDVELLRKREIVKVKGRMDDEEIANLFNGIKRSTWDRKRKHGLDMALKKANDRFLNSAQFRVFQFMKKHVYNSWKFLTFFATMMLLILTAFQAFCDVYGCSDHFFPA